MDKKCYIYFIRCGKPGGPIKIGMSHNVERRLLSLQTSNPYKLTLIVKIQFDSKKQTEKIEKWLHNRFKRKHLRGEWFKGSIKLKQIDACMEYAIADKDWDEVRIENGGRNYHKN